MSQPATDNIQTQPAGLLYALLAFGWWGCVFPAFLIGINTEVGSEQARTLEWSLEILANRVVWSLVVCGVLVVITRRTRELLSLLQSPKSLGLLTVTSLLIATNWAAFIYGTAMERLSEASLGYYISPLLSVLLGMAFLGERLSKLQWLSVLLATAGVLILSLNQSQLPWIALAVATTFSVYGLLRKRARAGPVTGLTIETAVVFPLALGYLLFRAASGPALVFGGESALLTLLLVASGPFTAAPLLWFAAGARRLRLSTLGFLQFLSPTMQLFVAVGANNEKMDTAKFITFGLIWTGVILFAWDSRQRARREPG